MFALPLLLLQASAPISVEADDTRIDEDCVLRPLTTAITDANGDGVIQVVGDGITVDLDGRPLRGAAPGLSPDAYQGIGIVVRGRNVTLRNVRVSGFLVGIHALEADGLVLEDCDVSDNRRGRLHSTPEAEDASDWLSPHRNDANEWLERYGAGIVVEDASGVTVRRCRARNVQNGLILDRVERSLVYDNDFSFLSGWGVALWRSSRNAITRNALDFCVRGYSHGIYNRGQDSAGLLLFEQCSQNVIAENSITHGGDGLFAFAGQEALGEVPAPRADFEYKGRGNTGNVIARNDLSYAAAHGLELTFSFGNQVFENRLVGNAICGIWGGYSRDTVIAHNLFAENGDMPYGLERGGINVEHGQRNVVLENRFTRNACGVHLWWDDDTGLEDLPWTVANGFGSGDNLIIGNTFEGDTLAVQLRAAGPTTLAGNVMERVTTELEHDEASPVHRLESLEAGWETPPEIPVFGDTRPIGARGRLAGREHIVMTEWGPYDHERPLLHRFVTSGPVHVYEVFGAAGADGAASAGQATATGEVELTRTGARWTVAAARSGLVPYRLTVEGADGPLSVQGLLVDTRWDVRFFPWSSDPREDEAAWRSATEGGIAVQLPTLDLAFGSGGPAELAELQGHAETVGVADLPRDRFGTRARTRLRVPVGRWRVRTVSDDGLRLWIDEELVIDDWTHHADRVAETVFETEAEREILFVVEHFELDGAARLSVSLQRDSDDTKR